MTAYMAVVKYAIDASKEEKRRALLEGLGMISMELVAEHDFDVNDLENAFADAHKGEPVLVGVDFGGDGSTVVVARQPTAKIEEQAERLYERLREGKPATRAWKDLPDVERWIWRRAVRFAVRGRERLKERMLDEPAITKAEGAQRSFQKAADDPWDDTGWAEPMTEAVAAAFDYAVESLIEEAEES